MKKRTTIVILKALNQLLFYVDKLRHQTPEHGRCKSLEETRQEIYAELRELDKGKDR